MDIKAQIVCHFLISKLDVNFEFLFLTNGIINMNVVNVTSVVQKIE